MPFLRKHYVKDFDGSSVRGVGMRNCFQREEEPSTRAPQRNWSRDIRHYRFILLSLFCVSQLGVSNAHAETMDPAVSGLVQNPECRAQSTSASVVRCLKDQAGFRSLVNQYGAAIAPSGFAPAQSTGYGGFEVKYEASFTQVDANSDALKRGTRGRTATENTDAQISNASPNAVLQLHSLKLRKGLGFGLEASAQVGFLLNTSMMVMGGDLRLSILEGFEEGPLGYLPDLAVGGAGRTVAGSSELSLATFDIRAILSKSFTIANASRLTPILGYQYLWIHGRSEFVDFTPEENALVECEYAGPNQPGTSRPSSSVDDASPVCSDSGNADDFNNIDRFELERLTRQRLFLGLNYQYEYLVTGAQFLIDIVPPSQQNRGLLENSRSQWNLSIHVGAAF